MKITFYQLTISKVIIMSNATPSRLGQINKANAADALFLKVFSGEVMATFNAKTVMADKTRVRNIQNGKSAQFPSIGKTVAEYHVPGAEILGNKIAHDEKVITIDDLLIANTFIANIDEAKNHYEVRSEYSRQMGDALAQTYDRNLLSLAVNAARNPAGIGKGQADFGDAKSVTMDATPTFGELIELIYDAAAELDEKNIPEDNRFVFVSPTTYYGLVKNDKILNRDFGGTNGSYSDGKVLRVAGMEVVKTNNLKVDHTASTAYPDFNSKYAVDATTSAALIMHPQALGTVKLMDMASEAEYDIRRQGTLMVSKMAVGHGVLRPECVYEVKTDGTNNVITDA